MSAVVCVSLLVGELSAAAQPFAPPPPPLPPPIADNAAAADALAAAGRYKKRVGVILMATGSAIAVAGTGLMIAGSWDASDGRCYGHAHDGSYYYDGYYSYYGACGDTALTVAGATTMFLGIGALVPGIVLYVRGGSDVDEARRLRCAGICW